MKYKLLKSFAALPVGHVFETGFFGCFTYHPVGFTSLLTIYPHEILLMELAGIIEEVDKKWVPKVDEKYWFINDCGGIEFTNWSFYEDYDLENHKIDDEHYKIGNCFRTKEEAEVVAERVRALFQQK